MKISIIFSIVSNDRTSSDIRYYNSVKEQKKPIKHVCHWRPIVIFSLHIIFNNYYTLWRNGMYIMLAVPAAPPE